MNARKRKDDPAEPQTPWWRVGMVWLVIGGPLTVVVAATATAVIAVRNAEVVLPEGQHPVRAERALDADTPAMQARNHAATARP